MDPVVEPIYRPDRKTMRAHVEHLFGGWLPGAHEGKVELAWTDTVPDAGGRYNPTKAQLYGTDQLDALVKHAAQLNAVPMCNVYVGASLKHPDTPPFGRTGDSDSWALTALYSDLDDDCAAIDAAKAYGLNKPTLVVVTGVIPWTRAQLWWRLDEPLMDEDWSPRLEAIATAMKGDHSVTNSGRLMRLAGSIAWPTKEGRTTELTAIQPLREPGPNVYMPEHLALVWPPQPAAVVAVDTTRVAGVTETVTGGGGLGLGAERLADGRERYMLRTVLACLIELLARNKVVPTPQELFDVAWPQYERRVDFSRPGRGPQEMLEKCAYAIERYHGGKIPGVRSIADASVAWKAKQAAWTTAPQGARDARGGGRADPQEPPKTDPGQFPFETIADLRRLPPVKWLVRGWVPEGTTVIIYGKWGAGKSFLGFDICLHMAYGMTDWHGAELPEGGADVLILAREGHQGFVQRIDAFKKHHGILDDTGRLLFMRAAVSFMRDDEFKALCEAVKAQERTFKFVLIDTVARVLPGVEMSKPEMITQFMERCSILSALTGAAVAGVHHQNKAGTMMGSIYFEANADVVYEATRLGEEDGPLREGEIVCTKMKDGEDRWKRTITYKKILLPSLIEPELSSLVIEAIDERKANREGWPAKPVCRDILNAIDVAWRLSRPYSNKAQAKRTGRYAPRALGEMFNLPADLLEKMIATWIDKDVLSHEVLDRKNRIAGLRVVGSID